MNLSEYSRRPSCEVRIGRVVIGGGHPVAVQSMTNTDTNDTEASVAQIERIDRAGCATDSNAPKTARSTASERAT